MCAPEAQETCRDGLRCCAREDCTPPHPPSLFGPLLQEAGFPSSFRLRQLSDESARLCGEGSHHCGVNTPTSCPLQAATRRTTAIRPRPPPRLSVTLSTGRSKSRTITFVVTPTLPFWCKKRGGGQESRWDGHNCPYTDNTTLNKCGGIFVSTEVGDVVPNCLQDHSAIAPMLDLEAPTFRRELLPCAAVPLVKKPHAASPHAPLQVRTPQAPTCAVAPPHTTLATMVGRTPWCRSALWRKMLLHSGMHCLGGPRTTGQTKMQPRGVWRTSWASSLPSLPNKQRYSSAWRS